MKVLSVLRTTLLVAAVLGMCAADAKKHKLCDADGHPAPAPTPAKSNNVAKKESATVNTPVVVPVVTPAPQPMKPQVAEDADDVDDNDDDDDDAPAPIAPIAPAAPVAPASPAAPGAAPASKPASQAPAPAPAPAPAGGAATNAGSIKGSFAYKGKNAGGPGTYQMVTNVGQCAKTPHSMSNPVSPLDDDLTLVFRGPMTIHNIAIFDGSSGAWTKVSSYAKGGATTNMVFMNNRNVDYSGASSPQGFSSADGKSKANSPTQFAGELAQASKPGSNSIYADEKTGAEVNIFQDKKCGQGADCKGYYDKDGTAYLGWGGAKKIFVTKVQMPNGGSPNLPAIWALNGQIVRSGQYGCNCRGMGKGGGCGELDIAEVLDKDTSVVATHYYYYEDGTGHDSWGKRPTNAPTTYITVIDESYGVKVLEIGGDDFDFNAGSLSSDVVGKWLSS